MTRFMLRQAGIGAIILYAVGTWVYAMLYIWENWAGFWSFGTLAYYAFMRALVWPLWVFLDLIGW